MSKSLYLSFILCCTIIGSLSNYTNPTKTPNTTVNDQNKTKSAVVGANAVIISTLPSDLVALQQLPNFPGSIVLTRPTATSMTFMELPIIKIDSYTEVVSTASGYVSSETKSTLNVNESTVVTVSNLLPNTNYTYFVDFVINGTTHISPAHSFQTQRALGSTYKFSVIADSHLFTAPHCYPPRYAQTLNNVLVDQPDFVITLGDDFRTSNIPQPPTAENLKWLMVGHRPYHNVIGRNAPLFNVNGNHEMEEGWLLNGTALSIPVMVATARLNYYANPRPDGFYSGNSIAEPNIPKWWFARKLLFMDMG